nr:transcription termination factor Rho [Olsenella urininfantis]
MAEETDQEARIQPMETPSTDEAPKPKRRRRATKAEEPSPEAVVAPAAVPEAAAEPPVKRRRGRPRKADQLSAQAALDLEALNRTVQEATRASSVPSAPPQTTLSAEELPAAPRRRGRRKKSELVEEAAAQDPGTQAQAAPPKEGTSREAEVAQHEHDIPKRDVLASPASQDASEDSRQQDGRRRNSRRERTGAYAGASSGASQRNNRNQRNRRNRRGNQAEQALEPSLSRDELQAMKVADLRSKAAELKVEYVGVRKKDLVETVYLAAAQAEGFRRVEGVLDIQSEGYAFLRTGNYMSGESDAFVHQQLIRHYALRAGDKISGSVGPARSSNSKFPPLQKVDSINGRPPEEMRGRPRFRDLTPIYPNVRLVMEHGKDSITGRAIDLVAPIGKGQRGLIVSPPKAGKTTVLKKICQSIATNNPEVHLFCLLVDERPEEVTDMERSIRGEVVASTFDMPADNHTAVAELVIEHAKRLVEMGEDVVVVLDSITRLARAYNLAQPASGRILSGGVDSAALYPPKKFLGAARNIEGGGSLTILASALVDTGSKMDEVIFEEFKGTGNMELKLDRDLADRRIFPAIDPVASGTRNEDLLIDAELQPFIWGIRRVLANMNNTERAASALVKGLRATKDNEEFLIRSAKKAQQNEYMA